MTEATNHILGENMLPLADVAKPVFNISPRIAQRKAATNTLPVPAFRIGGTRKGPMYVLKDDLEKWVRERSANAKAQHRKMQAV
ncbi:pyocin activator PrtN family protein [Acidovorax sp. LjRoot74]|uniref:pyocin activator PrtN family protein n=1 Tax=Acidovorax sp. LjRoot74 TaxID=3342337 RepID=UPI003ECF14AD